MKPTTLTVFELFEKERRYTVPLFQRPYVWERQWTYLWTDVQTRALAILDAEEESHALRKHFLGAVVLNHVKVFGRQVPSVEVIDGQQRLTTLQILLVALRDVLAAAGEGGYDSTLLRVTENTCRMEQEIERFKVWPTNADRETFENVLISHSPAEIKRRFPRTRRKYARKDDPRPRLVEAYLHFYQVVEAFIQPETADEDEAWDSLASSSGDAVNDQRSEDSNVEGPRANRDRVDALVEAISHHLELVIIELEERDDPQAIFESLNGLGEPLLPSDLIRNFVFQQAVRAKLPTEELYRSLWEGFDRAEFWQVEERQGRLRRKRFDLFIFHYLIDQTERDLGISQLYQDFKDWWSKSDRDVEFELHALKRHSEYFRSFLESSPDAPAAGFYARLRAIDTSTVYPVLLSVLEEWRDPVHPEVQKIFNRIESYLVRRSICTLTPKNYNRVFLALLRALHKDGHTGDVVEAHLAALEGDSVRWPTDKEFREAWITAPSYSTLGPVKTRMVLEAIEAALHTKYREDISINAPLTIEHVMPQEWETGYWPLPDDLPEDQLEQARFVRNRLLHSMGNLTLLTNRLNPSVSNGPFLDKRPRIAAQSALRLNVFFQDSGDVWNEEHIVRRGGQMFEVARGIWPRPDVSAGS